MGKQNTSMKIQWNGNTGGVVGYSIRGHHYTRSLADSVRNPRTEAQLEQRAKFAYVSQLVSTFGNSYVEGYRHYNTTLNQRANFTRNLFHTAVTGNRTDGYTVDWAKVQVSRGGLSNPYNVTAAAVAADHKVALTWTDNSGVGAAAGDDTVAVTLYNATRAESLYQTVGTRADEEAELQYPAAWQGDTLHVYLSLANGTAASDSIHAAQLTA